MIRAFVYVYITAVIAGASQVRAQQIVSSNHHGGSGVMSGGVYTLRGSTGQPVTAVATAGNTTLIPGFWGPAGAGAPELQVDQTLIQRSAGVGDSSPRASVSITSGGIPIAWTEQADQPWVQLARTSGTTPDTLDLSLNTGTLAPRTEPYTATLTIQAGSQTKTIQIVFLLAYGSELWVIR